MTGTILLGARFLLGQELVEGMAVRIADGVITDVMPEEETAGLKVRELDGGILAPGFIDLQVNGGGGVLFNDHPTLASLKTIAEAHRRHGTTGMLPTVITDSPEVLRKAIEAVSEAVEQGVPGILGIHVEGPILSDDRRGIHDPRFLAEASEPLLSLLTEARAGKMLVTLAPEMIADEAIARLIKTGVVVAAGHTDASYERMTGALAAGVTGVTHLFNAMSPLANRAPGAVGAALDNQEAFCGVIVDGVHVHPAALRIAMRSRPVDRFFLVTDAMPPAGHSQAEFELQGRKIAVREGRCVSEDGTLAGSALTMDVAVRNTVELLRQPVGTALMLAAGSPARFMGLAEERGAIAPGKMADLVWLDGDLQVRATWIAGREWEGNLE